jgi:hypothetical protein
MVDEYPLADKLLNGHRLAHRMWLRRLLAAGTPY